MRKFLYTLCALIILPTQVLAVAPSDRKSINYETPLYSDAVASTGCDSGTTSLRGDDNIEQAFNFFVDKGLTVEQSAGIVGNLKAESGVVPGLHEIRGTERLIDNTPQPNRGYGIAQWTPVTRQEALINYAASLNPPGKVKDLDVELEFLWKEMTGKTSYKEYDIINKMRRASSVRESAVLFLHDFEKPLHAGLDVENARTELADEVKRAFGGSGGGSGGGGSEGCGGADIGEANIEKYNPPLASAGKIRPTAIVLHWWGGNAPGGKGIKALDDALRGNPTCGSNGCSVQLGILKDGRTYQMTKFLNSRAIHATCANDSAIGIEIEGTDTDFGASGPEKRPEQFAAVVATTKFLMEKYDIPLDEKFESGRFHGVTTHKHVDRECETGNKPDVDDEYFAKVKEALQESDGE